MPSPRELEQRIDELAAAYEGTAFADAVRSYSDGLDEAAREELKVILLRRARALEDAVGDRFEAQGWLRRTFGQVADGGKKERSGGRGGGDAQQP
ncbi:MAG TPA: hypothetical protein VNP93_15400 [Gaiellaceae bacterium]|nr:hypothetical protein [Gaiellaceae bacterium]